MSDALKLHKTDADVVRQALAVIFSILSPDAQTKYSLARARQSAMNMGLVDTLSELQKTFRKDPTIVTTAQNIMNTFMKDWS